jgi:hypothetical protein
MKNHLIIIGYKFMVVFLFILNLAQAKFQQRFNLNYGAPKLRDERFNSSIRTLVNYIAGNSTLYYHTAIGTSYNSMMAPRHFGIILLL